MENYFASEKGDQTIYLYSDKISFNAFQFASRRFTITTNNSSGKFNTLILFYTSDVISKQFNKDPNNDHYHIDIQDEKNIIGKLEQVYQGNSVKFNDIETENLKEIMKKLGLKIFFATDGLDYIINHSSFLVFKDSTLQIPQKKFMRDVQTNYLKSFTIQTKKREYKCNIFGILSSKVIRDFLKANSESNRYVYNYEDEEGEFNFVCSIFNFESVKLTKDNAETIKEIATDLGIEIILKEIDNYIDESEKLSKLIDDQQNIIDTIDELFDLLYHIKENPIDSIVETIKNSRWSNSEENIYEFAAFILQIVEHSIEIHKYLIDLLIELDKLKEFKILLPFVVERSILLFLEKANEGDCDLIFPFVYLLGKRKVISKERITIILKKCELINSYFISWFFSELMEINSNLNTINFQKKIIDKKKDNENNQIYQYDFALNRSIIKLFYPCDPNKIEVYKTMRDNGEDDNEITKSLREDDIDKFQSIVTKSGDNFLSGTVKPNMFEPFDNNNIRYLNYAAFHGSIKCFKYILINNQKVDDTTFNMAIAGGNIEIIRIVDNEKVEFSVKNKFSKYSIGKHSIIDAMLQSIKSHRNDLFDWLIEKNLSKIDEMDFLIDLVFCSIENGNPHALVQLIDNGFHFHNCSSKYSDFLSMISKNGFSLFLKFLLNLISDKKYKESIDSKSAVYSGNIFIFKLFEKKMNKKEIKDAFYYAISFGWLNIVQYISSNYDFKYDLKMTLKMLKRCFENNSKELLDFLIDKVKDNLKLINIKSLYDLLKISYKSCNLDATKVIFDLIYQNNPNNDFTEAFFYAANSCLINVIELLINSKYCIDYTYLITQITLIHSNEEIYELMMNHVDSELKKQMFTQLNYAIYKRNKPLIKFLLKNNASIEDSLHLAVQNNELEIVEMILEKNQNLSYINGFHGIETVLTLATRNKSLPIIKRLLSIPGIDPNIYRDPFITPLILSICLNDLNIFNLLVNFYGDEISKQKWQFENALKIIIDFAFYDDHKTKISSALGGAQQRLSIIIFKNKNKLNKTNVFYPEKILLKIIGLNLIDPNLRVQNGTLLSYACKVRTPNLFSALIANDKIDLNLQIPETGDTPLITAIKNRNLAVINQLINHPKTNINQKNYIGYSPLTYAVELNDENLINLILKNEKFNQDESNINLAFILASDKICRLLINFESIDVNYAPDQNISNLCKNKCKSFLVKSIMNLDKVLFDLIIHHPSFHKTKKQIIEAIVASISANSIEILTELLEIGKEFDININSVIIDDKYTLLFGAINSNIKMISFILNHPDFQVDKNDILKFFIQYYNFHSDKDLIQSFFTQNTVSIINLLYNFDCEHNHLIDDKIKEEGKSFFRTMFSTIFTRNSIDPNEPDKNKIYPLQFAIENNSYILSLCIIKSEEIDINKKIKSETYLHLAATFGRSKILDAILTKDSSSLNATNDSGETPLMNACLHKSKECIKVLFKYDDLDFLHKNNKGKDVIDMILTEGENRKEINTKDEYLSELLRLIELPQQTKQHLQPPTTFNFSHSFLPPKKTSLDSQKSYKSFFKPNPPGIKMQKIDADKMKKSMELNKQKKAKNENLNKPGSLFDGKKIGKEVQGDNKLISSSEISKYFQFSQPKLKSTTITNSKKKFETYNESFSEKPDDELQMLLNNLRKKSQIEKKVENKEIHQNSHNLSSLSKGNQSKLKDDLFDYEEINLYSSYKQQIHDQNQLLYLQQQQQHWFQMIQMNNQFQSQINMQMMNQYNSLNKIQQKSKRKKKSSNKK